MQVLLTIALVIFLFWWQSRKNESKARPGGTSTDGGDAQRRFLFYLSALMAKITRADGQVDESELKAVGRAFSRLGLTSVQCQYCVNVFQRELSGAAATDPAALCTALCSFTVELREVLYEILWDIACANGRLSNDEKTLLRDIALWLHLRPGIYDWYYRQRIHPAGERTRADSGPEAGRGSTMDFADACQILGCQPSSTPDELKAAYHARAKQYHPDLLRAQGLPGEMLEVATRKMAEINAAWDSIKRERGL